jgi:Terminase large subunit, T4likevirus-type, N-terminal
MPVQVVNRAERAWRPTPKQEQVVRLPFSVFEALYGGAVGGGKSELLYMLPIVYGFHENPNFHGVLFRETFPQLEASLILRAIPIYKLLGATYDSQKHTATFPSGARVKFSYVSNIKEAYDHDTIEYQYMGFDELTHLASQVYLYLTSRVRSLVEGIPPIIRSASNPGNVGHLWVRQRFVEHDPSGSGRSLQYDPESETYRAFIKATVKDNPHLLKKDPGYFKRLKILNEADYRAKVLGDWWTFAGQVFTEWRDHFFGIAFPDEPPNASHVIEDFNPPLYLPRIVACDWGYSPGQTWVGWAAILPNRKAVLYREKVWQKTLISIWGAEVARICQPEKEAIVSAKLDPSAWGRRGEEKTIAEQIIEATGLQFEKADNDRIGGKELMHEFLRWKARPPSFTPAGPFDEALAFRILRNNGPQAYKEYVDLYTPEEPESNLPRLQICKSCEEFRKVIPACVYPEDDGKGNIKKEDVAEFTGDDAYDGGRYLLKAIDDYCNLATKSHARVSELGQIVERLEQTKNWNGYYREMARYEAKHSSKPQSVARHRSSRSRYRSLS